MMLQEIAPHIYDNSFCFDPPEAGDLAFVLQKGSVLLKREGLVLPTVEQLPGQEWRFAFRLDGRRCYLCLTEPETLPEGMEYVPTRAIGDEEPREVAFTASVAASLSRWYATNRFCGHCAAPMEPSKVERAMVCPDCGNTVYPKICPAVIVAVTDGDRLLLTRYAGRAFKRWALVAGFAEIGESIEDTVRREVLEETGLHVKDLRFYRSQPWCMTDTLLMGFYCRLDGSDEVRLQEDELSEGRWFDRHELSDDHTRTSLTGEMIEHFREFGPEAVWGPGNG